MTKSNIEGSERTVYNREYPDIKKITVSYEFEGEKRTLKINTPLLMRMMLYEFAQEYYQFVEHEDTEHWQVEVAKYISKPKKGKPKSSDAKNIKALIKAYLDFTIREGIFKEDDADLTKYLLIGQLLTVAGLEEYVESDLKNKKKHGGYINEKDFYHKRIASRLEQ